MDIDYKKLKSLYQQLIRFSEALPSEYGELIDTMLTVDFNRIVDKLQVITGEKLSEYKYGGSSRRYSDGYESSEVLRAKVKQVLGFLEGTYALNQHIITLSSLANTVHDEELKNRCMDILSSPGPYDRAVNQATQVLEDRIRSKSTKTDLIGEALINAVFKEKKEDSALVVDGHPDEHSGFGHLCRGVFRTFRNPSHHTLTDKFSQEDALKFCAFVDTLLTIVNNTTMKK